MRKHLRVQVQVQVQVRVPVHMRHVICVKFQGLQRCE